MTNHLSLITTFSLVDGSPINSAPPFIYSHRTDRKELDEAHKSTVHHAEIIPAGIAGLILDAYGEIRNIEYFL